MTDFHFYSEDEVKHFATLYFDKKGTQDKLYAALAPVVERFKEAPEEERADFRGQLTDYVRLYAFLSQVITFVDTDLEKLYVFGRLLLRRLPVTLERLPVEIQQNIDIESYRIKQTSTGKSRCRAAQRKLIPLDRRKFIALPMKNSKRYRRLSRNSTSISARTSRKMISSAYGK
jgi:type I restriction enzyme R subunit